AILSTLKTWNSRRSRRAPPAIGISRKSDISRLSKRGPIRVPRGAVPKRPGATLKAQGLNQLAVVWIWLGATHAGLEGTGPATNGSPTISGRSEPPLGTVPLWGTPRLTVNGWPVCSVRIPLMSQLPSSALRNPLVSICRPEPKGNWYTRFVTNRWLVLYWHRPRSASRLLGSCGVV